MTARQQTIPGIIVPLPGKHHPVFDGWAAKQMQTPEPTEYTQAAYRMMADTSGAVARPGSAALNGRSVEILEFSALKVMLPMAWVVWVDQHGRGIARPEVEFVNPALTADNYVANIRWVGVDHIAMPDRRPG